MPVADRNNSTRPITNRQRVSSHDLYQSMSVLRGYGLEEDLFQRDWDDVHRHGAERARLVEDPLCAGARQHREHATLPPYPLDARRAQRRLPRIAVEHHLDAAEALPEVVDRTRHHQEAATEESDAVREPG